MENVPIASHVLTQVFALLIEADVCARNSLCAREQFAVEVSVLTKTGLTNTGLRWLGTCGYVQHFVETSELTHPERSICLAAPTMITEQSCYMLSGKGVAYAADYIQKHADSSSKNAVLPDAADAPCWEPRMRELRFHGVLVKRLSPHAGLQKLILDVFQEEGWPCYIDDPLPPTTLRRLRGTILRLNSLRHAPLLRFCGNGDGATICWRIEGSPTDVDQGL